MSHLTITSKTFLYMKWAVYHLKGIICTIWQLSFFKNGLTGFWELYSLSIVEQFSLFLTVAVGIAIVIITFAVVLILVIGLSVGLAKQGGTHSQHSMEETKGKNNFIKQCRPTHTYANRNALSGHNKTHTSSFSNNILLNPHISILETVLI